MEYYLSVRRLHVVTTLNLFEICRVAGLYCDRENLFSARLMSNTLPLMIRVGANFMEGAQSWRRIQFPLMNKGMPLERCLVASECSALPVFVSPNWVRAAGEYAKAPVHKAE